MRKRKSNTYKNIVVGAGVLAILFSIFVFSKSYAKPFTKGAIIEYKYDAPLYFDTFSKNMDPIVECRSNIRYVENIVKQLSSSQPLRRKRLGDNRRGI